MWPSEINSSQWGWSCLQHGSPGRSPEGTSVSSSPLGRSRLFSAGSVSFTLSRKRISNKRWRKPVAFAWRFSAANIFWPMTVFLCIVLLMLWECVNGGGRHRVNFIQVCNKAYISPNIALLPKGDEEDGSAGLHKRIVHDLALHTGTLRALLLYSKSLWRDALQYQN